MTAKQYKAALKKVGLSIGAAGPFLGFNRRTSFRIAAGDAEIPEGARKLLELMAVLAWTPQIVEAIIVKRGDIALNASISPSGRYHLTLSV